MNNDVIAAQNAPASAGVEMGAENLFELKVKELWAFMKTQDLLFWLVCLYLFLEYVRPQTLYPAIDILPYTQIVIILSTILLISDRSYINVKNIQNILFLVFFGIIILSSTFALSPPTSFVRLPEFIAWLLVYYLIINIVNSENRFLIFLLMFLLYNFKMAQFAFRGWARIGFGFGRDGTGGGPGWFQNSGEFGVEMCIFFAISLYFYLGIRKCLPPWKRLILLMLPVTALTGIIASSSRGAVVGGVAVFGFIIIKSGKRFLVSTILVLVALGVLYHMMPQEQIARFEVAGDDSTSINRTIRWEKGLTMAEMYPVLGVGYANWAIADQQIFGGDGSYSHNIFIEAMSELGYSGLVVFCLMIIFTFVINRKTRKYVKNKEVESKFIYCLSHGLDCSLVGYLVSGFFVTVLYYPFFWINLAMTVALNNITMNKYKN